MEEHVSRSGGVDLQGAQIDIGGDVVGRDKIVQNINNIVRNIAQRPLTAAEEADLAQSIESKRLRQGVTNYLERLCDRVTAPTDTGGPYKGLLEFHLSDAAVFFGRQQAIGDLLEHVRRSSLTSLHAESGAGKTSLLQAGISPRLIATGHLPVYLRPYNISPALAIKRAFIANLNETPHLAQAPLRDFLSRICAVLGAQATLYLFIDQLEEFFTHLEETRRAEFVNELATCLEDDSLNVRWVVALRSEFFGNLANFRPRIRHPFENDYRLNRLTHIEAREAIAEPATQKGIGFEDGLIDAILDDLGKEEVAPPQVQLVCSALYETLSGNAQVITRQSYDQAHGAKGILREHLGRVLRRDLPADQRPIAQHTLEALITSDVQRVLRSRAELATDLTLRDTKPETLDQVLNQLVDSRLLRAEEMDGQLSYELAHDYLLTEIQLDSAVQARKAAQELLEQEVRAYQRYGTLLSDDKFAILAPRRAELVLNDDAQALLHKSERALKRRQRLVFGGIGLVIVLIAIGLLSIVTAIGAGQQQQAALQTQHIAETAAANANTQKAGALSSAATAQVLQATAKAGAAIAATREAVANETLRKAYQLTGIVPVGNYPKAFAFDGTRLWVANSGDDTVQAIDPTTAQIDPPITVGHDPSALVFDGTRVWVANTVSNTVQAIDPTTAQIDPPITVGQRPSALVFDGTRVWVANHGDNTVQAIDPSTGQVNRPLKVGRSPSALTFDGERVWVANHDDNTVQAIDRITYQAGPLINVGHAPFALIFADERVWVANQDDNTVQAIDPATGLAGLAIKVGSRPSGLTFDGRRVWVANDWAHTLQSINPVVGRISKPIKVGGAPNAFTFDNTRLWVANSFSNTVQPINPATGQVGVPIEVGKQPTALTFDGIRVWVANHGDNTVQAINPNTGQADPPIEVGKSPRALAFDGKLVWVVNYGDDNIQAIDPTTSHVSAPIKVGQWPTALTFDGTRIWIANWLDNTVQAISPITGLVDTTLEERHRPSALAYDGKRVWIATAADNESVEAIDPTTGGYSLTGLDGSRHIWVGDSPSALASDGRLAWVANGGDGTVQAIDATTGRISPPIKVGEGPSDLAFAGKRLWVANSGDGSVQYIDVSQWYW